MYYKEYYNLEQIGRDTFPEASIDDEGNPVGSQYDLGVDEAFECFRILYCHFNNGEGPPILQDWLTPKGFAVTVVTSIEECTAEIPNFKG